MNKKTYVPLHVHSFYSLLDGLSSPKDIVDRCVELGLPACALTDHGSIAGMKVFYDEAKKQNIKCILGVELYICEDDPKIKNSDNNKRYHLIVLAKNDQGIQDLMALISETNKPEHFYRKPRINMEGLKRFTKNGNLYVLSACIGGELPVKLFSDFKLASHMGGHGENIEEVKKLLKPNWKEVGIEIANRFQDIAGKGNFFIELQNEGMTLQIIATECLREISKATGIPSVATIDAHYCAKENAEDQRLLLCAQLHTTKEEQERRLQNGEDIMDFFVSDEYYIPSYEEMREKFTEEELLASVKIADSIHYSSIGHKPYLPIFENEESKSLGLNSDEYLKHICLKNAKTKLGNLNQEDKKTYWQRLQKELIVIKEAGLADYFLIVWDACQFIDKNNGPRGRGRGSGAGSLVNYLTGITGIDPIEYGLYFERFYNMSRNIPPHFDVCDTGFMSWMSDNFETLHKRDVESDRKFVSKQLGHKIKHSGLNFTRDMRKEVEWIDANNPKMWLYIKDMIKARCQGNTYNSHLAYGLGIVDDIDLSKEVKFHNGHISLPDIDTDIGVVFRNEVISYLKDRWGNDYVAQMITFGRLQGKAALKEVFRANPETVKHLMKVRAVKEGKDPSEININIHDLCNDITSNIPDEAAISDELQQLRKEHGDDYGILQWSIHHVDSVGDAYKWYKPLFDQAIRIEGTKKSQSRHAAGIVIADIPIEQFVPLAYDSQNKDRVVGVEMNNAENMGAVKFDFLGVVALDKLWTAQALINGKEQELAETGV